MAGSGYTSAPTVAITGTGTGATAVAEINQAGQVIDVVITNPGSGYTSTPTFAFSGGGGSGAAANGTFNTAAGGLTKIGSNTLTLSGVNTYTGATTISAGTLQAGVASVANVSGAFGNNSAVTLSNVSGALLNITGFDTQIGSLTGGGATGGNVVLGASTLTVGGDNTSPAAYAGVISGTGGSVNKIGSGTQILTGVNTYTGSTTITGGTLQLGNGGISGSLSGTTGITNNGMLVVNRNNPFLGSVDLHGAGITGTGGFAQIGSGTTTLDVANSFTGGTVISNGQVSASVSGSLGSGTSGTASIAIANTATLLLTGAGNLDRVRNDAAINLGGGTVAIASGSSEGTAATVSGGTNSGTGSAFGLGALTLSANSTLNFDATGNSTLLVFNSFAAAGFTLNITGYTNTTFDGTANSGAATDDRLVFNSNLTPAQLAAINFGSGITATEIDLGNGYFEVGQAIPEPASLVYLGAALLGLTGWRSRRKARR